MEIYHFAAGQPMQRLDTLDAMPAEGIVWLDFERPEAAGWEDWPLRLLGVEIDAEHVSDVANAEHPSFFDGTEAYDLMVFEGLGVRDEPLPLETRVAALVLFDRLLITVRSPESRSFAAVKRRLNANCGKAGTSILWLSHLLLDTMVDRYLGIRAPLMEHFHGLQERLLNLRRSEVDWRGLMSARRVARQLESLSEAQIEALDTWRRRSRFEWKKGAEVRLRDLTEHVGRVRNSARALERDLDAAVQLRFAAMSQRANEVMRVFTVVAVVFMPLTLLTGIWGMNFEYMPELHWRYGYPIALLILLVLGVGLFYWFKRKGYV